MSLYFFASPTACSYTERSMCIYSCLKFHLIISKRIYVYLQYSIFMWWVKYFASSATKGKDTSFRYIFKNSPSYILYSLDFGSLHSIFFKESKRERKKIKTTTRNWHIFVERDDTPMYIQFKYILCCSIRLV